MPFIWRLGLVILPQQTHVIIPEESPLLAVTFPGNERCELPPVDGEERVLRFDGTPIEGIELDLEFGSREPVRLDLVEERTGLPSFPALSIQPEPGTMRSLGEFNQGDATDFTAIHSILEIPGFDEG